MPPLLQCLFTVASTLMGKLHETAIPAPSCRLDRKCCFCVWAGAERTKCSPLTFHVEAHSSKLPDGVRLQDLRSEFSLSDFLQDAHSSVHDGWKTQRDASVGGCLLTDQFDAQVFACGSGADDQFESHPPVVPDSVDTERGNVPYKAADTIVRKDYADMTRNAYLELVSLRSFGHTQHSKVAQALLRGVVDGHTMRTKTACCNAVFNTIGHALGFASEMHMCTLKALLPSAEKSALHTSAANVLSLLAMAAAFGNSRYNTMEWYTKVSEFVSLCLKKVKQLVDDLVTGSSLHTNTIESWALIRSFCRIAVATMAFFPPPSLGRHSAYHATDDAAATEEMCAASRVVSRETILAFLGVILIDRKASVFCPRQPGQLELPLVNESKHRAIQWLTECFIDEKLRDECLTSAIGDIDAQLKNPDGTVTTVLRWERRADALHTYHTVESSPGLTPRYQFNLWSGEVYINGDILIGLPDTLRASSNFKHVFGSECNVEVVPNATRTGYRATMDFSAEFLASTTAQTRIEFEFLLNEEIVMTEKTTSDDKSFTVVMRLLPKATAVSICGLDYLPWYVVGPSAIVPQPSSEITFFGIVYRRFEKNSPWIQSTAKGDVAVVGIVKGNRRCDVLVPAVHKQDRLYILLTNEELHVHRAVSPTPKIFFEAVRRFESNPKFVSTLVMVPNGSKDSVVVEMRFERFDLTFRITSTGDLIWAEDSLYRLAPQQAVAWLPCHSSHLRLTCREEQSTCRAMQPAEKILIAMGDATGFGLISPDSVHSTEMVSLKHFALYRHEHFGYYETATNIGRMYVALLLAVHDCNAAELECGTFTCAEQSVLLLRHCFSNKPWSVEERRVMGNFAKLSNVVHPTITLVCAALERFAHATELLPHPTSRAAQEQDRAPMFHNLTQKALLFYETLQKHDLLLNRLTLRPEEASLMIVPNAQPLLARMCGSLPSTRRHRTRNANPLVLHLEHSPRDVTITAEAIIAEVQGRYKQEIEEFLRNNAEPLPIGPFPLDSDGDHSDGCQTIAVGLQECFLEATKKSFERSVLQVQAPKDEGGRSIDKCKEWTTKSLEESRRALAVLRSWITECSSRLELRADASSTAEELLVMKSLLDLARSNATRISLQDCVRFAIDCDFEPEPTFFAHRLAHSWMLTAETIVLLRDVCWQYIRLAVTTDVLLRIKVAFETSTGDVLHRALHTEISRPDNDVEQWRSWVALEAEQRFAIRLVQYQTWSMLYNGKQSGAPLVTQLNMGEGKTRVIIPMLILSSLRDGMRPCVHMLSAVARECAEYYETSLDTPGLGIKVNVMPFNRDVEFDCRSQILLRRNLSHFSKSVNVVVREHFSSYVEKREEAMLDPKVRNRLGEIPSTVEDTLGKNSLHIFDEVDELLRFDFSLVYAAGDVMTLPYLNVRAEILTSLLQHAAALGREDRYRSLFSWDEVDSSEPNTFPKAYLLRRQSTEKRERTFLSDLLAKFLKHPPKCCSWITPPMLDTITNHLLNKGELPQSLQHGEKAEQLCLLRGAFLHDILLFVLSRRAQESYGVPPSWRETKLAVPYESADVPSKRSEFAQPDVSLLFTFLTYFHHGISYEQFVEALKRLVKMPIARQEAEFRSWVEAGFLGEECMKPPLPSSIIDLNNTAFIREIFGRVHKMMAVISFWVRHCVFAVECKQYPSTLSCTSWDIANVGTAVGFSGTSDSQWLFPENVVFKDHDNNDISGATGVMIRLLLQHTLAVVPLGTVENNHDVASTSRPESVLNLALSHDCDAIIDVGAAFAGKSNRVLATIVVHRMDSRLKGVCFFDTESGCWAVMERRTLNIVPLQRSVIAAHECLAIYDQARCRGSDLKLNPNTKALVTLGVGTSKDTLMQAVGRLRAFGRNQKVVITAPLEILEIAGVGSSASAEESVKQIIRWTSGNTLSHLSKGLPLFTTAAVNYSIKKFKNCSNGAHAQPLTTIPSSMYKDVVTLQPFSDFVQRTTDEAHRITQHTAAAIKERVLMLGGEGFQFLSGGGASLSQTSEREVQRELQKETDVEIQITKCNAIAEAHNPALIGAIDKGGFAVMKGSAVRGEVLTRFSPFLKVPQEMYFTENSLRVTDAINGDVGRAGQTNNLLNLRIVTHLVVFTRDNVCLALSDREANDVCVTMEKRTRGEIASVVPLQPYQGEGLNLLLCPSTPNATFETTLRDHPWLQRCITFTAFFNGISMFQEPVRDNLKTFFNLKGLKPGTGALDENVKQCFTLFLQCRQLHSECFPSSDLETVAQLVADALNLKDPESKQEDSSIVVAPPAAVRHSDPNRNKSTEAPSGVGKSPFQ